MHEYTLVRQERPRFGAKPPPLTFTLPSDELAFMAVSNEIGLVLTGGTFNVPDFYDAGGKELLKDGTKIFPPPQDEIRFRGKECPKVQFVVVGEKSGAAK